MLKHKMKQWLSDHQPETLRSCGVKAHPSSPRSMTPPLPLDSPSSTFEGGKNDDSTAARKISSSSGTEVERSPSTSAVNIYPSLKSKILGPKMGAPSSPLSNSMKDNTVNGNGATTSANGASSLGRSFSSTTDLAAAAAQATGLGFHSKRKREDSPTKPSPIKVVRVKEEDYYDFDGGKPTTNGGSRNNSSKPSGSKPPSGSRPSGSKQPPSSGTNVRNGAAVKDEKAEDAQGGAPKVEETDDDIARRLHQELNCAPMRHSRSRRNISCAQETMAEDPVHGQDPGILPSC